MEVAGACAEPVLDANKPKHMPNITKINRRLIYLPWYPVISTSFIKENCTVLFATNLP